MACINWITYYLLCDKPSNIYIYMACINWINILPSMGLCMNYRCDSARDFNATIGCRMLRRCNFGLILILLNTTWITLSCTSTFTLRSTLDYKGHLEKSN